MVGYSVYKEVIDADSNGEDVAFLKLFLHSSRVEGESSKTCEERLMSATQQRPPELNNPKQDRTPIKRALLIAGAIILFVLVLVLGLSWYQNYTTNSAPQATPTPESTIPAQGGSDSQSGGASTTATPATGGAPAAPVVPTPTRPATPTSAAPTIPTPFVPTPPPTPALPPTQPAQSTPPGVQVTPTVP